ncbi:MAG TPA: hypothetical protein VKG26_06170 [Bacteroidia bacterium]|nr:hypothetical protein [Bacteroidia bacterium]
MKKTIRYFVCGLLFIGMTLSTMACRSKKLVTAKEEGKQQKPKWVVGYKIKSQK